ncbi:MAG: FG-GAP repeat protein, partial [Limisphaerales bacterium]
MKTSYSIKLVAFVSMLAASATLTPAITSPETNALISEVEIGAPSAIAEGRFGQMLAARSNLVVIGYRTTPESNPSAPLAAVYRKSAVLGNFNFQGELRVPGVTNLSVWDLATDGNRIALATGGFSPFPVPAIIYLFAHDGTQWILESTLVPSEDINSFAMSENIIVAGATAPFGGSGKVLVFENIDGSWQETSILPPEGFYWKYNFGRDVATQGGNILVGSTGDFRIDEGHAYIYSRVEGAWRLQADLICGNIAPSFSLFGERVAIDGDTALVTHYSGRFNSGHVDVFERSDLGWSKVGVVGIDYGGKEDYFGLVPAIGGKNIVVGAPEIAWGMAYLFRKNGAVFDHLSLSRAPYHGEYPEDAFGTSVAVDGNTVYVGAPLYDGSVTNQGVAYAFEFNFPVQLHSSWARHSDNSFHFAVTELKVGKTYTIESCSSLETEWRFVKQFTAYAADMELDVGLSTGTGSWFFRL